MYLLLKFDVCSPSIVADKSQIGHFIDFKLVKVHGQSANFGKDKNNCYFVNSGGR